MTHAPSQHSYPQASDSGVRSGHKQSSLYSVSVFRQKARAAGGHLKGKKKPRGMEAIPSPLARNIFFSTKGSPPVSLTNKTKFT
jgi:hypothetical protein